MTKIFRQISNRQVWEKIGEKDGVPPDQAPSDVLHSFKTEKSGLSIYFVENTKDSIERLVAAFCCNRANVSHLDYVLLDHTDFEDLQLQLANVPGDLPDAEVNAWHRDVVSLSVESLAKLAIRTYSRGEVKRAMHKDIGKMINALVADGKVRAEALKPELLQELKHQRYQ